MLGLSMSDGIIEGLLSYAVQIECNEGGLDRNSRVPTEITQHIMHLVL